MNAPLGYQYVTIRCVPRADREEFVNVGIVLYCQDADFLACAAAPDPGRLAALDPGLDQDAVDSGLSALAIACAGDAPPFDAMARGPRFGWLSAPRSTVLRPGPIHGGLTTDPAAELERLVDRLVRPVSDPPTASPRR